MRVAEFEGWRVGGLEGVRVGEFQGVRLEVCYWIYRIWDVLWEDRILEMSGLDINFYRMLNQNNFISIKQSLFSERDCLAAFTRLNTITPQAISMLPA